MLQVVNHRGALVTEGPGVARKSFLDGSHTRKNWSFPCLRLNVKNRPHPVAACLSNVDQLQYDCSKEGSDHLLGVQFLNRIAG